MTLVCVFPPSPPLRGFGFVTFVDQAGVDKVLAQTRHELDSKTVSPLSANLHIDAGFLLLSSFFFGEKKLNPAAK